jgi:hypothetical protein
MCCDHERAADQCDCNLPTVRGQFVTKPSGAGDTAESDRHQNQDGVTAVLPESSDQRDHAEECYEEGEPAMRAFFGG